VRHSAEFDSGYFEVKFEMALECATGAQKASSDNKKNKVKAS
jgi:hypothetical protein